MKTEPIYNLVRFFLITFLLTWIGGFIAGYFSYQQGQEGRQGRHRDYLTESSLLF